MLMPGAGLYPSLAARIVSDPAHLGIATFLQAVPILAAYTPSLTLTPSGLTLGTGTLAALASTVVPISGLDPVTGQYKLLMLPPAGGWKWLYDAVTPAPPATIYGYAVTDVATGALLMGVTPPVANPPTLTVPSLVVLDELSFLLIAPPLQ
jgi:hypothetical protein